MSNILYLRCTNDDAERSLTDRIEMGSKFEQRLIPLTNRFQDNAVRALATQLHIECKTWNDFNLTLLNSLFDGPFFAEKYQRSSAPYAGPPFSSAAMLAWLQPRLVELYSIRNQLPLFCPRTEPDVASTSPTGAAVFLVHGRNHAARDSVFKHLTNHGADVIVLEDRPNGGRTVIEKIEDEALAANYAVVLFTGDDVGALVGDEPQKRARQNVVFELGYFIGKLGRGRVCLLRQDGTEMLSDLAGVVTLHFDSGGAWKLDLLKELKAADVPVELVREKR